MFQFKQFTIQQDRTAMKVCTDACVLGAYADVGIGGRLLDIGTGTGLLALMAAQRNPTAQIDAVEIDPQAAEQAAENKTNSPFASQIRIIRQRIQDVENISKYDRIITNPPFYTNSLRSTNAAVNRALHTDELPFTDLLLAVQCGLSTDGQWWVLLPPYESSQLIEMAKIIGLYPFKRLALRHHAQKPIFRNVVGLSRRQEPPIEETLSIYNVDGQTYTTHFRTLLRDFYVIF